MRIGVIGAMLEEINMLKQEMDITSQETIAMREYYIGELYGREAVLVFSKCGKVAAAATVTTLIERYKVDVVIFTGVAGAADRSLKVGDIVVSENLIQHDMDASGLPIYKKFEIPLLGVRYFEVEKDFVKRAFQSAREYVDFELLHEIRQDELEEFGISKPKVVLGTIASGDQFIADSEKIRCLTKEIDNLKCVEMEGAAVAQVCYEYGVPYVVLRVISDEADESADINFGKFIVNVAAYMTRGIVKKLIYNGC